MHGQQRREVRYWVITTLINKNARECVSGWMLVHKEEREKEKEHKTQLTV